MPQLETGKISCVRRPCYGRLSPRQRIENVLTAIKLLVTTLNRPLCEPILEPLISIKQFVSQPIPKFYPVEALCDMICTAAASLAAVLCGVLHIARYIFDTRTNPYPPPQEQFPEGEQFSENYDDRVAAWPRSANPRLSRQLSGVKRTRKSHGRCGSS